MYDPPLSIPSSLLVPGPSGTGGDGLRLLLLLVLTGLYLDVESLLVTLSWLGDRDSRRLDPVDPSELDRFLASV